jgi:hypothetical protein
MKLRRRPTRVALAFTITFGTLLLAFLAVVFLLPGGGFYVTRHIPANIPTYSGVIGQYAPSEALQVSFNNFTAIRAVNRSALMGTNYLAFQDPKINISVADIELRISVVLTKPNATVDVTVLNETVFGTVSAAFDQSSLPRTHVGGLVVFSTSEPVNGKETPASVAILPSSRAFVSSTGDTAQDAVSAILSVYDGSTSSLLSRSDIQRMFYVMNGTTGHLALGIQDYAGAVTSGQMTFITVDKMPRSLAINYAVMFSNATFSQSEQNYFAKVYLGAQKFAQYDNVLLATESQPISALTKAIVTVG